MRITVDMDPRDVWRIEADAERKGVRPGDVLRDELAKRRSYMEFRERVRARVLAGMCDADIAAEFGRSNGSISDIRRGMGLRANPRYTKKPAPAAGRKTA